MNLKQLEAFQAIMISGSATAAGERLGVSQSAISRLVAQLESALGLRLFVRQKGRLLPTREAEALLQDTQRVVDSAQGMRRHSEQLRLGGFSRKLLKVAIPHSLASTMMPELVRRFMALHPAIVLEALSMSYLEAGRAVLGRDADIGFVRLPLEVPGLKLSATLETSAVCVLPRGHRLQSQQQIGPLDLMEEPLVLLGRQREMRSVIDRAFRQARVLPRIAAEVHSVGVACSFVAAGLGVSVVNALMATFYESEALLMRPFVPRLQFQFGLARLETAQSNDLHEDFERLLLKGISERVADRGLVRVIVSS